LLVARRSISVLARHSYQERPARKGARKMRVKRKKRRRNGRMSLVRMVRVRKRRTTRRLTRTRRHLRLKDQRPRQLPTSLLRD